MSGNQEPRISLPTWRCSDFNAAAIPIKKRKYFVHPQPYEQGGVGRGSSEKTMNVGEPIPSFPSVSLGKAETFGNKVQVKVEEENFPIYSTPLAGFEIPKASSNIFANSHPGVVVTSGDPGTRVEHTLLKTHDIVRGEGSAGEPTSLNFSAPPNTDSISICTKPGNHSGVNRSNWDLNTTMDDWEDAIDRKTTGAFLNSNTSLHDIDTSGCCDTTVIAKSVSGNQKVSVGFTSPAGTSMQLKPTCSLSLGLSSYHSIEKPSSLSATTSEAIPACKSFLRPSMIPGNVNPVNLRTVKSEAIEESVRQETESAQDCPIGLSIQRVKEVAGGFSHENIPSSGILKQTDHISVKAEPNNFTQSEIFNRRDGTLNHPHTPRTQPNEILDLPTSSRPNQKDTFIPSSTDISNAPISLNGIAINPGDPSDLDLASKENRGQGSSTSNGKLCEVLKHGEVQMTYSCSGHEDHNLNASGVNATSLTEEKILGDCKTFISKELSRSSRGTDELSIRDKENNILSGKEPDKELFSHGFESDCGLDLSREIAQQVRKRDVYDDNKVRGPAAVIVEGNESVLAGCRGSETKQRGTAVPFHPSSPNTNRVEKGSQPPELGNTYSKECSASSPANKFKKYSVDDSYSKYVEMASTDDHFKRLTPELQSGIFDGSGANEGPIIQDGEHSTQQTIHVSEGMSGVSTLSVSGGNIENPEIVDNNSPVSFKAEISTIDNDSRAEFSEGSQSRVINLAQVCNKSPVKALDASDSFEPLRMERDRLPDFPHEPRKYVSRGSDESCNFSHGRYQRNPKLNFMPDRRRLYDQTESNLHERNTKSFEFDNYGNTRRDNAFMSSFHRGRRPANHVMSNSLPRRTPSYSYTHRGQSNKEDATSTFHGFRDAENFTKELQCNNTEPMFMSSPRQYQGRNSFARGRAKYLNNPKRDFPGFRSRSPVRSPSPVRSRGRSAGPSSSFRNRSQEELSGHTDFSHRRSPSGYRMGKISSPDPSGYPREMAVRRHNSAPYSHRPSNTGRGRGYSRGRGYARGRGYGRDGIYFRKPSDHIVHRNHGSLNNLDPRERVDYNETLFEEPIHSGRFGVDANVGRRQFGYRHDDTSSFRPSFNDDGCAPTNVENDPDAVRFRQYPDIEIQEQNILMEIDGQNQNSTENASGRNKDMDDKDISKMATG